MKKEAFNTYPKKSPAPATVKSDGICIDCASARGGTIPAPAKVIMDKGKCSVCGLLRFTCSMCDFDWHDGPEAS